MDRGLDFNAAERGANLAALDQVLASKTFAKSARLSSFIRYVCHAALEQRGALLTEQHIGVAVFGRPEHYNPAEDNIVRASARLLRQRLEHYYENEGSADQIHITLPRGGYLPVFVPGARMAGAAMPAPAEAAPPPSPARHPAPAKWLKAASAALVLVVATVLLWRYGTAPAPAASAFWAELMPKDRDAILVIPDSGLVLYQLETGHEVGVDEYSSRRAGEPADGDADSMARFRARRYTGISSVRLAAELGKRATTAPDRFHVRFARDLMLDELKRDNVIMGGVAQANPWAALFRRQLNFHIDWDPHHAGKFLIRNDHPLAGEQPGYEFTIGAPDRRGFATIALTHGLDGGGRALLLGGTTSAGTEAAIEFLTNPVYMEPLMRRVVRADGSVGNFEVLLECVLRANGSTDIRVLGLRIGEK